MEPQAAQRQQAPSTDKAHDGLRAHACGAQHSTNGVAHEDGKMDLEASTHSAQRGAAVLWRTVANACSQPGGGAHRTSKEEPCAEATKQILHKTCPSTEVAMQAQVKRACPSQESTMSRLQTAHVPSAREGQC